MTLKNFVLLLMLIFLSGCAREPEGAVATNVSEILKPLNGKVEFDISKDFSDARENLNFDIVSTAVVRDQEGALQCSSPSSVATSERIWVDSAANVWVRLNKHTVISYTNENGKFDVDVDGLQIARCNTRGRNELTLGVVFDARPRPLGWDGEGMHGFELAIPGGAKHGATEP